MNRRSFLLSTTAASTAFALAAKANPVAPLPNALPRWRGFNLLEKFIAGGSGPEPEGPFKERDFDWIARWGFNFIRLPMSYRCWASGDPSTWMNLNEVKLKDVDQAVAWGKKHGLHVNLNLHRIPGYCVNPPAEPLSLWTDDRALEAAVFHWKHLAQRYKGRPNTEVSFDLINEPANVDEASYTRVVKALVAGIHAVDPQRLIIADGLQYGTQPVPSLAGVVGGQSTRGYLPMSVSHYKASWVNIKDWQAPAWPMAWMGATWDSDMLKKVNIEPWQALQRKGVGVHVGEWGCFNKTPHDVALAWMESNLKLWQEAGWGWSLWNFRGSFGILNSDRPDVNYKNHQGQQLDADMLALLRRY
ncbi:glycoside hydrolase family 5 protein [Fibrella aquatilis]|uniref:Cellulase family glycosylhydrolase n=1 Tax=Fibrella aquatilis TaxID=2817059 RepID=A0A939JY81_9BACT|nr:cellulase family glycosylhydrolase [Fibrella aquatilis]MBO0933742.1 cellulase family glycosylhydrolase [Fibrella aquatilis]